MIDLSADLGEGAPDEPEVWPLIEAANVACGGHAGDEESMTFAVRRARDLGIILGAHPSYPDRENFGRVSRPFHRSSFIDQIAALREIADREAVELRRVKPHGALYNDAHADRALAGQVVDAMRELDPALAIVCPDRSQMAAAARAANVPVIREAFADRRYEPDGSLVSRKRPDALLSIDEAAAQAQLLATDGSVIARDGTMIRIAFDTICIHADMEGAAARLRAIRAALGR